VTRISAPLLLAVVPPLWLSATLIGRRGGYPGGVGMPHGGWRPVDRGLARGEKNPGPTEKPTDAAMGVMQ
jgi:hypothetical protein